MNNESFGTKIKKNPDRYNTLIHLRQPGHKPKAVFALSVFTHQTFPADIMRNEDKTGTQL